MRVLPSQCAQRVASATCSGEAPSNSSSSDSRTATIASTSGVPNAARRASSRRNAASDSPRLPGSRSIPRAASASSPSAAGSTSIGSGSAARRSMPSAPAASSAGEQEVGVGLQVDALHLEVRRPVLAAGRAGDHPQRGLAVLQAPAAVGAGPVLRHEPEVRRHAGRTDREQRREVREHSSGERRRLVGEPVRRRTARHQVPTLAPQAEVHVAAVADAGGVHLRGVRRAEPVPLADRPDRLAHEHGGVGGVHRGLGRHGELELPGGVLGVVLLDRDPLGRECGEHVARVVGGRAEPGQPVGRAADGGGERVAVTGGDHPLDLERAPEREPPFGVARRPAGPAAAGCPCRARGHSA